MKRRDALGLLAHSDNEERYLRGRAELLATIRIALGGMVALIAGSVTAQGGAALYYYTRRAHIVSFTRDTPDSIVETLRVAA